MNKIIIRPILTTLALGMVSGMRAALAPAFILNSANQHQCKYILPKALCKPTAKNLALAGAAFELVGDKLPFAPDRVELPGLTARLVSGAFAGGVIFKRNGLNTVLGATLGGASAIASAYLFYNARKHIRQKNILPDTLIAVAEDAIAITTATCVLR